MFAIEKDAFAFGTLKTNLIDSQAHQRFDWPTWLKQKPWTIEALMAAHRKELTQLRGKVDLLAGGPPCQGFSSAGRRRQEDPRNKLVERYLQFVDAVKPRMVLIENVKGIALEFRARSGSSKRRNFASELVIQLGNHYHVYTGTIRCSEFGVPQKRPRFFLVGMLRTQFPPLEEGQDPFRWLLASKESFLHARGLPQHVTSWQAISDLERSHAGTTPCPETKGYEALGTARPRTAFQKAMRNGHRGPIPDTRLARHQPHIEERFARIIAECQSVGRLNTQLNREMRERYGIKKMATRVLDPAEVAPTITSMPDDLLHYSEPRTLTVRENARLQTFPDWFKFTGKFTTGGHLRAREVPRFTQVANAVPPLVAEMWGELLLKYLGGQLPAAWKEAI